MKEKINKTNNNEKENKIMRDELQFIQDKIAEVVCYGNGEPIETIECGKLTIDIIHLRDYKIDFTVDDEIIASIWYRDNEAYELTLLEHKFNSFEMHFFDMIEVAYITCQERCRFILSCELADEIRQNLRDEYYMDIDILMDLIETQRETIENQNKIIKMLKGRI